MTVSQKVRRAFTLVEIMIVVLIIGILLAIAVPNFVRARESSRSKACVANLKQFESAKEQWAMDTKAATGYADPGIGALYPTYIKSSPVCPSSGAYTPGDGNTAPVCSIGANSTASYAPHQLP